MRLVTAVLLVAGLLGPAAATAQAAPATFTISVAGTGPFAPGTAVTATLSGGPAGDYVAVQQCGADGTVCGPSASNTLGPTGSATTTLRVHRRIGDPASAIDCATAPCQLTAQTFPGEDAASTPISIDGSVPIVLPV